MRTSPLYILKLYDIMLQAKSGIYPLCKKILICRRTIMDRIQKIQKAKSYLEMLASSIDPISQTVCEDNILKQQPIKNCLLYVSGLLKEIIDNNGEVASYNEKIDFDINKIDTTLIPVTNRPVNISTLVSGINKQIQNPAMKKFRGTLIKDYLVENGYLEYTKTPVMSYRTNVNLTRKSAEIGIITQNSVDKTTGEIKQQIKLNKDAQTFILDNLDKIVEFNKKNKTNESDDE